MQLVITIITMAFSFVAMVGGIFGMNLHSGLEESYVWFWGVTGGALGFGFAAVVSLITFLRYHSMLFVGDWGSPSY
jgi:Mg2+ and Co2+ transporter CorA